MWRALVGKSDASMWWIHRAFANKCEMKTTSWYRFGAVISYVCMYMYMPVYKHALYCVLYHTAHGQGRPPNYCITVYLCTEYSVFVRLSRLLAKR
jgi:hypothetical protein